MAAGNGALDGWWVTMRPTLTNLCEVLVPKLYPETPNFFYRSTVNFHRENGGTFGMVP